MDSLAFAKSRKADWKRLDSLAKNGACAAKRQMSFTGSTSAPLQI
ncbi:hypothetical protein RQN30_10035 [Arcanobacterium hippocoleae]